MTGTDLFSGLGNALITPFKSQDGPIDEQAFTWLIEQQINEGSDFIVPSGTTGESPTLTPEEHERVIELSVRTSRGRVPVLAGTGSNSTAEAVHYTKAAKNCGADGALVVSPYYNKPMAAGFLDYYRKVAAVGLPVVLYDIPGRTAKGVPLEIILQLANEGTICGIKWASGDTEQLYAIGANCPPGFAVLSGDDIRTFELIREGGHGVISVLGNLLPRDMKEMVSQALTKNWLEASAINERLMPVMRAMFLETNPGPIKTALALKYPNRFRCFFRSPMMPMEDMTGFELWHTLKERGIITQ